MSPPSAKRLRCSGSERRSSLCDTSSLGTLSPPSVEQRRHSCASAEPRRGDGGSGLPNWSYAGCCGTARSSNPTTRRRRLSEWGRRPLLRSARHTPSLPFALLVVRVENDSDVSWCSGRSLLTRNDTRRRGVLLSSRLPSRRYTQHDARHHRAPRRRRRRRPRPPRRRRGAGRGRGS